MPTIQDTYNNAPAKGYPGMVSNMEPSNRISRTVEDVAGIAFGAPAWRGSGDRLCTGARALVGAGSEAATNAANTGTITDAPTVAAPARPGRYVITIVEPAANAGNFIVQDPDGVTIGEGTVAVAYNANGLQFTVADGATDFSAGDQLYIDVTGGEFLGMVIADEGQPVIPGGVAADIMPRYSSAAILNKGCGYVRVGSAVTDGAQVQVLDGEWVATGGEPCPGWIFDETVADDGICRIARR